MNAISLQAIVDSQHRLIVEIPPEVPIGPVTVTIEPTGVPERELDQKKPLTREEARQRLLAQGVIRAEKYAPEGAIPLSDSERERIGRLLADDHQSILDLVNDDRGQR